MLPFGSACSQQGGGGILGVSRSQLRVADTPTGVLGAVHRSKIKISEIAAQCERICHIAVSKKVPLISQSMIPAQGSTENVGFLRPSGTAAYS